MFRVCFALVGLVATQTSAFVVPATNVVRAPKASTTQLAAVRTMPLFLSLDPPSRACGRRHFIECLSVSCRCWPALRYSACVRA